MMIPHFSLPSKPATKISLKEATVSDLLDFADLDPDHEEEVTTLFLNRLQDKATFSDSKEWSAEDRRFGLFWYWVHTTEECEVAITYQCGHCGESHTYLQDFRKLLDSYQSIKGLPERDFNYGEKKYTVKPLTGGDMEYLESMRLAGDSRADKIRRNLERLSRVSSVSIDTISNFTIKQFREFEELVETALMDMRHGLETELYDGKISLILPEHECPATKEATTRLRVLFRTYNLIPAL